MPGGFKSQRDDRYLLNNFLAAQQKTGDGGCDALTGETRLTGMFASIISETDISVIIPFYETIEIIASLFIRLYCIQI